MLFEIIWTMVFLVVLLYVGYFIHRHARTYLAMKDLVEAYRMYLIKKRIEAKNIKVQEMMSEYYRIIKSLKNTKWNPEEEIADIEASVGIEKEK